MVWIWLRLIITDVLDTIRQIVLASTGTTKHHRNLFPRVRWALDNGRILSFLPSLNQSRNETTQSQSNDKNSTSKGRRSCYFRPEMNRTGHPFVENIGPTFVNKTFVIAVLLTCRWNSVSSLFYSWSSLLRSSLSRFVMKG